MVWSLFRARRVRRPACRRFVPTCEALEDRTVLDAGLFADLGAAQFNRVVLDSLAHVGTSNPQVAALAAQVARNDFAIEQSLFQEVSQVRTQLAGILGGQIGQLMQQESQLLAPLAQQEQSLASANPLALQQLRNQEAAIINFFGTVGKGLIVSTQAADNFLLGIQAQAVTSAFKDMATPLAFPLPAGLASSPPVSPASTPAPTQGATTTSVTAPATATATASSSLADPALVTLKLNPLDINLLGLEVQTNQIQVNISAQPGNGQLLGNLLTTAANLVNLQGVNNALNTVLGNVVTLLDSTSLNVNGVNTTSGPLSSAPAATTPVLDLFVAPVHLNLLGALVDTSPIHLTITAHSGPGLVLGNVLTDLANLFNPPLPKKLDLNYVNAQLQSLLNQLNAQLPGIGSSPTTTAATTNGSEQVLSLTVPPINLNLLGLELKTSQIQVNANAQTGNGALLGNLLTDLLNTLGATPQNLSTLNSNLNALLAKVVGVLNASNLVLPANALDSLSQVIQTLSLPNLVNASGTASAPILNLAIASTDGTTPPVDVNLLGLQVTTSNIQAQLLAQTGNGLVLGNLLYNVANLLNPGGSLGLLTILGQLGL